MKRILSTICIACLLCACTTNELDETIAQIKDELSSHTMPLHLYVNQSQFSDETATRTSYTDYWEDGATLYIMFKTKTNTVVSGIATYSSTAQGWTVTYNGSIPRDEWTGCTVSYFKDAGATTNTTVTLTPNTAVYRDSDATYYCTADGVSLRATLHPQTGRLRFKGTQGFYVSFSGIAYYSSYDIESGQLTSTETTQSKSITQKVLSSGYTPYVYGINTANNTSVIYVFDNATVFKHEFGTPILGLGQGGYLNIPTSEQHNGWSIQQPNLDVNMYIEVGPITDKKKIPVTLYMDNKVEVDGLQVSFTLPEGLGQDNFIVQGYDENAAEYNRNRYMIFNERCKPNYSYNGVDPIWEFFTEEVPNDLLFAVPIAEIEGKTGPLCTFYFDGSSLPNGVYYVRMYNGLAYNSSEDGDIDKYQSYYATGTYYRSENKDYSRYFECNAPFTIEKNIIGRQDFGDDEALF